MRKYFLQLVLVYKYLCFGDPNWIAYVCGVSWWRVLGESVSINGVCAEIQTKHINTLCGQNLEFVNDKQAVYIVTTGL